MIHTKTHPTVSGKPTYDSVDELAADLGISRASAYVGLNNGTIPAIRVGKRFVVPRTAIADWLKSAGAGLRPAA